MEVNDKQVFRRQYTLFGSGIALTIDQNVLFVTLVPEAPSCGLNCYSSGVCYRSVQRYLLKRMAVAIKSIYQNVLI